ncbi:flagellin [Thioalkalivibrio sp. AKL10]|uniref:flagellin N-terminal helical domain-containing protein n=1 Tax=Thioalkalivibrio sp. AKL10 TaxID=1158158 RepID=UPI000376260D|nr:flagellin [Thioalkalivibrio sp. AKL10]
MSQVINTNVLSLNAQRNLNNSQGALAQSLERLSSGLRINSAKDDAAGLAISERFTSQIRGLNQAARNANDGISFAQSAEGALGTVSDAMQRIRELAVQAANDTNSSSDREALNNEVNQLVEEINRVANSTEFNGENILNGALENLVFQVGANQNQTISVDGVDARGSELGADVMDGVAIDAAALSNGSDFSELSDDLTINGESVSLDGVSSFDDIVAAINAMSDDTGVSAERSSGPVVTEALSFTGPDGTAGTNDATIEINGTEIVIAADSDIDDAVAAINAQSSETGVTAENVDNELVFTSDSDFTIEVTDIGGDNTSLAIGELDTNDDTAEFVQGIDLQAAIGTGIEVGGDAAGELGFDNDNADTRTLNDVSVATREDATETIGTVDLALQQVSTLRSELGAVQVRFENTIANLEISSENLSAARSRIMDADFASETAELTRAQVLQQAGTSVLSQANAVPQNVLALLQ